MAAEKPKPATRFLVCPVPIEGLNIIPEPKDDGVTDIIIPVPILPPKGVSTSPKSLSIQDKKKASSSSSGSISSSRPPRPATPPTRPTTPTSRPTTPPNRPTTPPPQSNATTGVEGESQPPPKRKASRTSSLTNSLSCFSKKSRATSPPPSPAPHRYTPFQLPSAAKRTAAAAVVKRKAQTCASGHKSEAAIPSVSADVPFSSIHSHDHDHAVEEGASADKSEADKQTSLNGKVHSPLPSRKRFCDQCAVKTAEPKKLRSPKQELLRQYRLHIFVAIIFVVSVTFISCAWVYHNKARAELAKTQRIFFDPRQRTLTLSHPESGMVVGKLALDIPKWHLPLHCPIQEEGNPYSKECVWKRTAVLRVQHFSSEEILCYNISWENLKRDFVPYDCYDFGDALWYGPSNLSSSMLPIRGEFTFNPNVASATDNGVFGTAVDYTWLSSTGGALVVTSDDPVRVEWNTTTPGKFCLISNYSAAFYNPESRGAPSLNYSLCNGPDMVTTYKFVREYFGSLNQHIAPDRAMMKLPQWSSKAEAKSRTVSEDDVVALATNLKKNGMNCSLLHVDGKWEAEYGDLSFDPDRFSNYSRLVEAVKGAGCEIALELSPFFDYRSPNFHEGVQRGYFVKDAGGRVTGMARWQHGVSGVLDITNPAARSWFTGYVTGLSANNQVSAFRWTYGNASWLPYQPHFNDHEENPSKVRRLYGEALASLNKKLVVEEASESQHLPAFISVQSSVVFQGDRGCLGPTIEHALSVSILGYPWLLADGFRVVDDKQSIHGGLPSRDVFIRWMQLAAFFPAVKYSLSPWSYDDFTVGVARNMSLLHQKVVLPILDSAAMTQDIQNGLPVLRPVWWAGPDDEDAHVVNDEFLIGGAMLIAPILCEGVERRDIFIPEGIWKDRLRESLVVGPKWLRNYKVELYEVAHFSFEHVYEKKPPKPKTTKIPL